MNKKELVLNHNAMTKTRNLNPYKDLIRYGMIALGILSMIAITLQSSNAFSRSAPESFADLAERLLPTVVNIQTVQGTPENSAQRNVPDLPPGSPFQEFFDDFLDRDQPQQPQRRSLSLGSGFFISSDGYVLTNNHVIGEAIEVSVTTTDGTEYEAEIIGRDADLDVALLKVNADVEFAVSEFGDSDETRVGEWVLSIGNPFGLGGSVTAGIISAHHRNISSGPYDDFIQTDASINRGNSGGPLFNMDGQVIGMNTMIFTPNGGNIGIGFSIPSNAITRIIDQLREFGRPRRGWIGVSIQNVSEEMAEALQIEVDGGAILGQVNEGGPAEKAGLRAGDILLSFNGEHIDDTSELVMMVGNTAVGAEVEVEYLRNGETFKTTLITTERNAPEEEVVASAQPNPEESVRDNGTVLGMRVSPLSAALRQQFNLPNDVNGLVISNLARQSNAASRGLQPGDIIVQVNQRDVREIGDLQGSIDDAVSAERSAILLRIYRAGAYFMVPLPVESSEG